MDSYIIGIDGTSRIWWSSEGSDKVKFFNYMKVSFRKVSLVAIVFLSYDVYSSDMYTFADVPKDAIIEIELLPSNYKELPEYG